MNRRGRKCKKPLSVQDYNCHKTGVDLVHHQISYILWKLIYWAFIFILSDFYFISIALALVPSPALLSFSTTTIGSVRIGVSCSDEMHALLKKFHCFHLIFKYSPISHYLISQLFQSLPSAELNRFLKRSHDHNKSYFWNDHMTLYCHYHLHFCCY